MTNLDFTNEAETVIRFRTDHNFVGFREDVKDRYDPRMVRVDRYRVYKDGVDALVSHVSNLGAELRGLAFGHFDGKTVDG